MKATLKGYGKHMDWLLLIVIVIAATVVWQLGRWAMMVLGMIKVQGQSNNRLMVRYRQIKKRKRSGKAIIAMARKLASIVWTLLMEEKEYDSAVMNGPALIRLAHEMSEKATGEMSA